MTRSELVEDLKRHVLAELPLEDVSPDDLQGNTPLFAAEGLGLDSLDAVELVVLVEKHYGVEIDNASHAREIFATLESLADHILAEKPDVASR